jgi:hypothetical protein
LEFRRTVAEILEIPMSQAASYFSYVSKLWGKQSPYDLERRRSEWVLMLNTSVILLISVIVWAFVIYYDFQGPKISLRLGVPILAIVLSVWFSIRLFRLANRERQRLNQDFVIILQKNKEKILQSWNLTAQTDESNSNESE